MIGERKARRRQFVNPQEMWTRVREGCSWRSVAVLKTRLQDKETGGLQAVYLVF